MLQKSEERDVEVTRDDQAMINSFGRLNARMHELEAEKRLKEEDITNLQDASNELILADDGDDPIFFSLGESFVGQDKTYVEEFLEQKESSLKSEIDNINTEIQSIKQILSGLKVKLYAKFSSSINLEED